MFFAVRYLGDFVGIPNHNGRFLDNVLPRAILSNNEVQAIFFMLAMPRSIWQIATAEEVLVIKFVEL